ncbi:hypothetical protein GCM10009872_50330 [Actinopolymorpha rutila]
MAASALPTNGPGALSTATPVIATLSAATKAATVDRSRIWIVPPLDLPASRAGEKNPRSSYGREPSGFASNRTDAGA